ncbi:hypothetical protein AB0J84_20810 [Micromonospora arborensis]|uniref:hypothetical protein n=1 Tax=Micromonospora arborensis TaxID=2116518 RepID=UPI003426E75B
MTSMLPYRRLPVEVDVVTRGAARWRMPCVANIDARRRWREQQLAEQRGRLHPDVAQGDLEGFALVRPDGSLTAEVVHVQWMDSHPAGPDTHVTVSFADGRNVEFAFDVPVVKVRAADLQLVSRDDVRRAVPSGWGVDAER